MAYYCSTSGGRTQAVSDFRADIPQVPYLVSVPDPYDSISPHHDWGPLRFSGAQLASIPADAGRAAAARAVRTAREAGAPKVGVLLSSDYPSLQPGYYVVFSGRYARRSEAEAATRALRHRYPLAYARALASRS